MAKPNLLSSTSSASPAQHSKKTQRLRSSRPHSPHGIFTLLATISTSLFPANAHPLDPPESSLLPFLYPPFVLQPTPSVAKRLVTPSSPDASTSTTPPSLSTECQLARSDLPDKYVLGDDGLWHKTKWSLYGSTQCPGRCSPPSSVTDPTQNDVNAQPETTPTFSDPFLSSSESFDDFDVSSLPTGWNTPNPPSPQGTVVILALSVALAVIILVMFTCVFWRRKYVPRKDPEKIWQQSSVFADDDNSRSLREAKVAQRKWAKAASRWRDNIRFSARRRRTNMARTLTGSYTALAQEKGETVTQSENSPSSSRSPSPTPTQRSRTSTRSDVPTSPTASVYSANLQAPISQALSSPPEIPPSDISPLLPNLSISQPPAYHPRPSITSSSSSGTDVSPEYTSSDYSPTNSSKAPLSSSTPSLPHANEGSNPPYLSGHVATDDKAILSRRAALASAPPGCSPHFPQSVSVPSLDLEDADDVLKFPSDSRPSSSSHEYGPEPQPPYSPPTSLLPPPPSKGKFKYDYSRDLDLNLNFDIVAVEPELGPSAPPFEESGAVPSAPPMHWGDSMKGDDMDTGALPVFPGHVVPSAEQFSRYEEGHTVSGATPVLDAGLPPPPPPPTHDR
ncbi:hypothetical protein B0F90DRAFT_1813635 [Multifurca ochricompacta]|uniref:Uncharacterized protein n=1 Tax=Multifurca ochricompacta TaxID=376703 RepID=A0AAD4MFL5_9AGAM|nr:hypothetical protein B0F90DRAFT_1813635 [Multifurca ochricompacta]